MKLTKTYESSRSPLCDFSLNMHAGASCMPKQQAACRRPAVTCCKCRTPGPENPSKEANKSPGTCWHCPARQLHSLTALDHTACTQLKHNRVVAVMAAVKLGAVHQLALHTAAQEAMWWRATNLTGYALEEPTAPDTPPTWRLQAQARPV